MVQIKGKNENYKFIMSIFRITEVLWTIYKYTENKKIPKMNSQWSTTGWQMKRRLTCFCILTFLKKKKMHS